MGQLWCQGLLTTLFQREPGSLQDWPFCSRNLHMGKDLRAQGAQTCPAWTPVAGASSQPLS